MCLNPDWMYDFRVQDLCFYPCLEHKPPRHPQQLPACTEQRLGRADAVKTLSL